MELNDLKSIWKQHDSFQPKLEGGEIGFMLRGRSNSTISKLKRSIWLELVFTMAALLVLLYYSLTIPNGALKWSFGSFLVLFLGYIIYYFMQLNVFRQFKSNPLDIRTNLENLVHEMERYLAFYRISYSLLYPVYLILILSFVIIDRGVDKFLETMSDIRMILYMGFLIVIFLLSSLWFTKWYLKKLYGNHIDKLKELLNDIQESKE